MLVRGGAPPRMPQREVWLADRLRPGCLAGVQRIRLAAPARRTRSRHRSGKRWRPARPPRRTVAPLSPTTGCGCAYRWRRSTPELSLIDLSERTRAACSAQGALRAARKRAIRSGARPAGARRSSCVSAADHHVMLLTGHHIVLDGWSFWVLVRELAALYAIGLGTRSAPLAAAPSFVEYAAHIAERADGEDARRNVAWWTERFADGGPILACRRTGRARARALNEPSATTTCSRPGSCRGVRQAGAARGVSLFATLLAGFNALLHRLTGRRISWWACRPRRKAPTGLTGLVGHCVSMLPLRVGVDGGASFNDAHVDMSGRAARCVRAPGLHVRPRARVAADRARSRAGCR